MRLIRGVSKMLMSRAISSFFFGALIVLFGCNRAAADTIKIVAYGDSGVMGFAAGGSWPTKLEAALRARGWDVSITVKGQEGETASQGVGDVDLKVPAGTNLTIVHLGAADFGTRSPANIAADLMAITRKLRAMGSTVIIQHAWPPTENPAFAVLDQNAVDHYRWTEGLFSGPYALPQYDAGDRAHHLNAAGTDIVVARALPDVERVLRRLGLKPGI